MRVFFFALASALTLASGAAAQSTAPGGAFPEVGFETLTSGLEFPVAVSHAADERLFVSLRDGRVLVLEEGGTPRPELFLDLRDRVLQGAGTGLFDLVFHPRFVDNGLFFVHYVDLDANSRIARFAVTPDGENGDPASEALVLEIENPFRGHFGGRLRFGPDGFLYVSSGDSGPAEIDPLCTAPSLDSLEGKMLRLDIDRNATSPPHHAVPPSNPFVGQEGRDEIWAYGLRNPWRFSFDRETGDLWIGDVGEKTREEIDFQPSSSPGGQNYGWKMMEGTLCLGETAGCAEPLPACDSPLYTPPVLEFVHGAGRCAVTGGVVYRGRLIPRLYGHYLYGDFCTGTIWAARRFGTQRDGALFSTVELGFDLPGLVSIDEGPDGEIYLVAEDLTTPGITEIGAIYRLTGPEPPEGGWVEFETGSLTVDEDQGELRVRVVRIGGVAGEARYAYSTRPGAARPGRDYRATSGFLTFDPGDSDPRTITVPLIDDERGEGEETFHLDLEQTGGNLSPPRSDEPGARDEVAVTIRDDDAVLCVSDLDHLCLGGRFRVGVNWRTSEGNRGAGRAVPGGELDGSFWFFSPDNPEIFVKVLDACEVPGFESFWVFAAGLTDVETELTVTDLSSGEEKIYRRPLGQDYTPVRDTAAFMTCP